VTSVRPVNTTIYRSAYSRPFADFSSMAGTSRFVLIRERAGVK
jgi:hypothetical protein